MTIDEAISALVAAKEKIGGDKTLWTNTGTQIKWDEQKVVAIKPVDDGESVYVQLTTHPETPNNGV